MYLLLRNLILSVLNTLLNIPPMPHNYIKTSLLCCPGNSGKGKSSTTSTTNSELQNNQPQNNQPLESENDPELPIARERVLRKVDNIISGRFTDSYTVQIFRRIRARMTSGNFTETDLSLSLAEIHHANTRKREESPNDYIKLKEKMENVGDSLSKTKEHDLKNDLINTHSYVRELVKNLNNNDSDID